MQCTIKMQSSKLYATSLHKKGDKNKLKFVKNQRIIMSSENVRTSMHLWAREVSLQIWRCRAPLVLR